MRHSAVYGNLFRLPPDIRYLLSRATGVNVGPVGHALLPAGIHRGA
jgi:hypothetical protein